jgi:hypothetical protein
MYYLMFLEIRVIGSHITVENWSSAGIGVRERSQTKTAMISSWKQLKISGRCFTLNNAMYWVSLSHWKLGYAENQFPYPSGYKDLCHYVLDALDKGYIVTCIRVLNLEV